VDLIFIAEKILNGLSFISKNKIIKEDWRRLTAPYSIIAMDILIIFDKSDRKTA